VHRVQSRNVYNALSSLDPQRIDPQDRKRPNHPPIFKARGYLLRLAYHVNQIHRVSRRLRVAPAFRMCPHSAVHSVQQAHRGAPEVLQAVQPAKADYLCFSVINPQK
jgi:hypothetical protein